MDRLTRWFHWLTDRHHDLMRYLGRIDEDD